MANGIREKRESLFKPNSRTAINSNGLSGYFVANTAEKLAEKQFILSSRYKFHKITSIKGQGLFSTEEGEVSSFDTSVTYVGKNSEISATIPVQSWQLSAPRTTGLMADDDSGLGNITFAYKYTGLEDHSYYRFALGVAATAKTGNSERMTVSGSGKETPTKLFGCVTTKETDRATGNLELGAIINKEDEDWFIYSLGFSYELTDHASFIGEIAGEVAGSEEKDNMDMVMGVRIAPTQNINFEFAYYRNLRTYRAYGWDNQFQIGATLQW